MDKGIYLLMFIILIMWAVNNLNKLKRNEQQAYQKEAQKRRNNPKRKAATESRGGWCSPA